MLAPRPCRQGHPLRRCLAVLERLLQHEDAEPFAEPVSQHAQHATIHLASGRAAARRRDRVPDRAAGVQCPPSFWALYWQQASFAFVHPAHLQVDAEGLRLADYRQIIRRPMDLGTIRNRLAPGEPARPAACHPALAAYCRPACCRSGHRCRLVVAAELARLQAPANCPSAETNSPCKDATPCHRRPGALQACPRAGA